MNGKPKITQIITSQRARCLGHITQIPELGLTYVRLKYTPTLLQNNEARF